MEKRQKLIYLGRDLGTCDGWDCCGDAGDLQFYDVIFNNGNKYANVAFFLEAGRVELYDIDGSDEVRTADIFDFFEENTFERISF